MMMKLKWTLIVLDAETLWELDRYVTNYKKSLSKYKRKAEPATQARAEAEQIAQQKVKLTISTFNIQCLLWQIIVTK